MRERVTQKTTLTQQNCYNNALPLFTKYMTQLPSLVVFRGLVFEYWHYQIQTLVSPLKYRILFFITYREPTLNYAEAFFTFLL